jgi:hypothetical protein
MSENDYVNVRNARARLTELRHRSRRPRQGMPLPERLRPYPSRLVL